MTISAEGQHIETLPDPHVDGDAADRQELDDESKKRRTEADARITMRDL